MLFSYPTVAIALQLRHGQGFYPLSGLANGSVFGLSRFMFRSHRPIQGCLSWYSEPPHLEQSPAIPAVVEDEDDFFRGGAEVFGVFVLGEVFAEGGEDVLDAVGGAGFADDAEEGELEFVLEAFEATVVIDEVEEGFLGVADEDGEVEGDAEQLAEGGAAIFLGVEVGFGVAEFGVGVEVAFAVLVEVEQGGAAEHVLDDAVEGALDFVVARAALMDHLADLGGQLVGSGFGGA